MRQVGLSYKRCTIHQVDFRAPPVKLVADLLMYLFQDRKLQPSTIDGYRSDIADRLGNSPINISKDENLTRLLDSFHWDRPKGRKGIPSWNLSLAFAPADKGHFEPIKRPPWSIWPSRQFSSWPWGRAWVDVRYMFGKTEILDTSPTGQGVPVPVTQLSLQESAGQIGSRQCGPRGRTALAPTLDRSLKSDRSLCPVRALCYYLDRTSGRIRWVLSPLRKVSTKTSHLPLSPLGSSRLWSYIMSSLTWRPTLYIRLKPMMSGPLMLLRSSSREFPWIQSCQPASEVT